MYGPEVMYYVRVVNKNEEITSYVDYERMKNNELTESEEEIKGIFGSINSEVNLLKEKGASLRLLNKSFKYRRF